MVMVSSLKGCGHTSVWAGPPGEKERVAER